jgi:hypothetical protein
LFCRTYGLATYSPEGFFMRVIFAMIAALVLVGVGGAQDANKK